MTYTFHSRELRSTFRWVSRVGSRATIEIFEILLVCYETWCTCGNVFTGYDFPSLMSIDPSLARCTCQKSKSETLLVCYETWCTFANMFACYEFLGLVGLESSLVVGTLTLMCFLSTRKGLKYKKVVEGVVTTATAVPITRYPLFSPDPMSGLSHPRI